MEMTNEQWNEVLKAYMKGKPIDFLKSKVDGGDITDEWITMEKDDIEGFDFRVDICRPTPKPMTKKEFISSVDGKGRLTDSECKAWTKLTKSTNVIYSQTWQYDMGRIGHVNREIYKYKPDGSTTKPKRYEGKPFDWRPLGHYFFTCRGWGNEVIKIEGWIQDWADLDKISNEDSFHIELWKHPIQ